MSHLKELRHILGNRPLIVTGACVFIEDNKNRILLQYRSDNETWGLHGGSLELGETVEDCARREIREETGLSLGRLNLFHIFSGPDHIYTCPNVYVVHNVTIAYRSSAYSGQPLADGIECTRLQFFDLVSFPEPINPNDQPMLATYSRRIGSS